MKAEYYGDVFKIYYGVDDTYTIDDMEPKEFSNEINDLPKELNLRKKHPNYETLLEIRDQAFAAVEVMSDRIYWKITNKSIISKCNFML